MLYTFFLIVTPGLEKTCLKELHLKFPHLSDVLMTKGGLEIKAPLDWAVLAHYLLKIPTRILLRLESFKVKDYPKLFQKFSKIKWHQFLSHENPHFHLSCRTSRLYHTDKIEQTIYSALAKALEHQPLKKRYKNSTPQHFYIRLLDNTLTLSLDLTGEPLYKRGWQKVKGPAPLRESIASALVLELLEDIPLNQNIAFIDPMCGSATFLTEAFHFHRPLKERTFHFEECPLFEKFSTSKMFKECSSSSYSFSKLWGFDVEEDLLKKVEFEISQKLSPSLKSSNLFRFFCQDTLTSSLNVKDFMLICNPPYGERIKIKGKKGVHLKKIWENFLEQKPLRMGWLVPSDMDDLFTTPSGYEEKKRLHFKNGGLSVTFWVWHKI